MFYLPCPVTCVSVLSQMVRNHWVNSQLYYQANRVSNLALYS